MPDWYEIALSAGHVLGLFILVTICGFAVIASALSFSGMWLVAIASALAAAIAPGIAPGWITVLSFFVISAIVEGAETLAGAWGVRQRGGSKLSGLAAVVGGMIGLFLGGLIPIPIVGGMVGMLLGSFALVFLIEYRRHVRKADAANVAMGAVIARLVVLMLKVCATIGMSAWILLAIALRS